MMRKALKGRQAAARRGGGSGVWAGGSMVRSQGVMVRDSGWLGAPMGE